MESTKRFASVKKNCWQGCPQAQSKIQRERSTSWLNVANKMAPTFPNIEITSKAVRDRYKILQRKHKLKNAEEERGTGLGGEELTEGEMLLEELIDIEEETERRVEESEEKKAAGENRGQALEMRQRALERLGETRKLGPKKGGTGEKRRKSGQTFDRLREKNCYGQKIKRGGAE